MRFRHPDGTIIHLAYCTNVHPTDDFDTLLQQVTTFGAGVRNRLGTDRLGLGLWLPAPVAAGLARDDGGADGHNVNRLRDILSDNGLEVVTLNAFPYAGFHAPTVKKAVYRPDWTETARLDYTLNCASVLASLLPDDVARGSISTLPLGWRTPWYADRQDRAREHLDRLADGLAKIESETGKVIRVGLEPEPGCVIETTAEAVDRMAGVDTKRIGICLDACHLAVGFEDPVAALQRLAEAGLPVVKTQASAALHAGAPGDEGVRGALTSYAEDRFLHQVRTKIGDRVVARDDLPDALEGRRTLPTRSPWRVHFHVPLHQRPADPLDGTHEQLSHTLRALFGGPHAVTDHVEVETYTWSVLPAGHRPDNDPALIDGLAAEIAWTRDQLTNLGLESQ
jgi:sugar phosphate isomerase/epimerase